MTPAIAVPQPSGLRVYGSANRGWRVLEEAVTKAYHRWPVSSAAAVSLPLRVNE